MAHLLGVLWGRGSSTELKWKLPSGWKIGEIQWPIPLKTIDPGDIETYGYEDEVLLMQEITPPQKLDDSKVKLSAEANWLVCEKICIPGSATPQLELPVSTTNQPANLESLCALPAFAAPKTGQSRTRGRQTGAELDVIFV